MLSAITLLGYGDTTEGIFPGHILFFEKWLDEGEDVFSYDLVAVGGGMGVVALHHAVDAEDAFQEEWK
jgi:hypothetical protein